MCYLPVTQTLEGADPWERGGRKRRLCPSCTFRNFTVHGSLTFDNSRREWMPSNACIAYRGEWDCCDAQRHARLAVSVDRRDSAGK